MFEVILSIICVSIDGFFTGCAIGLKNTKIKLNKLVIISIIPIIMAFPVMIFGYKISNIITNDIIRVIGFTLFFLMAINSYFEIENNKETKELNLINSLSIGLSIGLDSSVCAFTLALERHNPFITPIYFGLSHFILIWLGNILFNKRINNKYIKYLSPITFLILAICRLF
jgi:putative Mn2+ efflux pump MntP